MGLERRSDRPANFQSIHPPLCAGRYHFQAHPDRRVQKEGSAGRASRGRSDARPTHGQAKGERVANLVNGPDQKQTPESSHKPPCALISSECQWTERRAFKRYLVCFQSVRPELRNDTCSTDCKVIG